MLLFLLRVVIFVLVSDQLWERLSYLHPNPALPLLKPEFARSPHTSKLRSFPCAPTLPVLVVLCKSYLHLHLNLTKRSVSCLSQCTVIITQQLLTEANRMDEKQIRG